MKTPCQQVSEILERFPDISPMSIQNFQQQQQALFEKIESMKAIYKKRHTDLIEQLELED